MLLSKLNLLATAPGGVARLRELILTLAVQGKLVPQDPKDEPAGELLKKIRAEKDRLIAEGKIKRDKPLAEIAVDEKPFGLPAGWEWVRLGAIGVVASSSRVRQSDWRTSGVPFYRAREIVKLSKDGHVNNDLFISEELFCSLTQGGSVPKADDIMITGVGTIGIPYVVMESDRFYFKDASVLIFKNYGQLNAQYLSLMMRSPLWVEGIHEFSMGTTVDTLTIERANIAILPLPPVSEQSRIVTRVEELMRLCDALEAKGQIEAAQHAQLVSTLLGTLTESETPEELADNWQRVATHFDLLLDRPEAVDALEQTILQLAVRGLLVPQDPKDESASELLKKVHTEKSKLIAAGKIKRDKPLPPISENEPPFKLPSGWTWARFPELGEFGRGKSKHRPRNDSALFNPPKYPLIQTGEVSRAKGVVREVHSYYSDIGLAQSRMWPKGTLCITIAANIAESAILGFDCCFPDSVVGFIPADAMGNVEYFLLFVEIAKTDLMAFAPATAQKNINLEILSSLLIPLPPLKELTRIVARVADLRVLCADLHQRLTTARTQQALLAGVLVQTAAA